MLNNSLANPNQSNCIQPIETYSLDQRIRGEVTGFLGMRQDMGKGLDINKFLSDADKIAEFIMQGKLPSLAPVSLKAVLGSKPDETVKQ